MTKANAALTADFLTQRYIAERGRIADIASEVNCTVETVRRALDRAGIARRDERGGAVHLSRRATFDLAEAIRLYVDCRMSAPNIGTQIGVDATTILRRLRAAGVTIRHHNDTKRGARARNRIDLPAETIIGLYREAGESKATVAARHQVSRHVVARVLSEAAEPTKPIDRSRFTGPNSRRWRHDLTAAERETRRDMAMQAKWRGRVYARDNFTCQCCGDAGGGNLHAHHIRDHATNRDDRWLDSNGVTLCASCHRAFHSRYGLTGVDLAMLTEFIAAWRHRSLAA